jgi:hypothetical protein
MSSSPFHQNFKMTDQLLNSQQCRQQSCVPHKASKTHFVFDGDCNVEHVTMGKHELDLPSKERRPAMETETASIHWQRG